MSNAYKLKKDDMARFQQKGCKDDGKTTEQCGCMDCEGERLRDRMTGFVMLENNDVDSIVCNVCLAEGDIQYENDEDAEDNIVICEVCLVGVHHQCYERDLVGGTPEEAWLCERGLSAFFIGKAHFGFLGKGKKGALICTSYKKTYNIKTDKYSEEQIDRWAHKSGINWLEDIWIEEENGKEVLYDQRDLTPIKGDIGKQSTIGACGIGSFKDCSFSFDVPGGMNAGLIKYDMDAHFVNDKIKLFGKKHLK